MFTLWNIVTGIYSIITSEILVQTLVFFILSIFCGILFTANFHYAKEYCQLIICNAGGRTGVGAKPVASRYSDYGIKNGPHNWKEIYLAANGNFQSPINIRTEKTEILKICEPLIWHHYDDLPAKVSIQNTGNKVELNAEYYHNQKPSICGADLIHNYSFISLCFRWSAFDDEGSEHSINDRKYPLEMQATHISSIDVDNVDDLGILMLSYFFTITRYDNPYLDPIILGLHSIRESCKTAEIPVFPLSWLCYPYKSGFYSYGGSLTEPPCTEGVTWFVQAEPMPISEKQLSEFRMLKSNDCNSKILKNSRPVQNLNSRIVCYNRYDQFQNCAE